MARALVAWALPFEAEHRVAWWTAGAFAVLSGCITCYQVYNHIKWNSNPQLRKYIIRIILMVPIYALESWLGLRFADIAEYFDLLRECYEAFVIYSFYQLLLTYLGGEKELVKILAKKPAHKHVFPCCWLPSWRMTDRFQIQFTQAEIDELRMAVEEKEAEKRRNGTALTSVVVEDHIETHVDVEDPRGGHTNVATTVDRSRSINGDLTSVSVVSSSHHHDNALSSDQPALPKSPSNPSPDFSGAASDPTLLPPEGHQPERPVFSTRSPAIPSSYLSPYSRPQHSDFLTHTQLGTLQYCVAKPVTALIAFVLAQLDLYGNSSFDFTRGYPYLSFITNMSQIWAMYTLVLFYMVCKEDLAGLKPVPKFLCVKAVVFFTFWQGVLIAILAGLGIIHETTHYTKGEVVVALQDFIVCLEMLLAALSHHFAFNYKDFYDTTMERTETPMLPALIDALNMSDVYLNDVRHVAKKSVKRNAKDNRVLTREEMHDMQYASFVAATGPLFQPKGELEEPLNPDEADSNTITTVVMPNVTSSSSSSAYAAPLPHFNQPQLVTVSRDVVTQKEIVNDVAVDVDTVTSERVTFEPLHVPATSSRRSSRSSEHHQEIVAASAGAGAASASSSSSAVHVVQPSLHHEEAEDQPLAADSVVASDEFGLSIEEDATNLGEDSTSTSVGGAKKKKQKNRTKR